MCVIYTCIYIYMYIYIYVCVCVFFVYCFFFVGGGGGGWGFGHWGRECRALGRRWAIKALGIEFGLIMFGELSGTLNPQP